MNNKNKWWRLCYRIHRHTGIYINPITSTPSWWIRTRGRGYYLTRTIVRVLFYGAIIALIVFITGYLWWTGGSYCVGSMSKCVGL